MPEDAGKHLLPANDILCLCLGVPDARVQIALFDIGKRRPYGLVMRLNHSLIATDQRNDGD